jgi:thymidylate synthase
VLGAHLLLTDPRRRFVSVPPVRVLNPAFAVAEALWILSGSDEPWIFTYDRSLERYADEGRLKGAYGPRMRQWRGVDQLGHVRRLLRRDPDSRQAVIQLYDPQRDTCGHRDVPCTLNYRFFLWRGRLEMHTTMRSNDGPAAAATVDDSGASRGAISRHANAEAMTMAPDTGQQRPATWYPDCRCLAGWVSPFST